MGKQDEESGNGYREMPEFVRKGLIQVQGGQVYLKAPYRVLWMRSEHKDWAVVTSIEYADWDKGFAVVRAVIMDGEGRILATAHSEESRGKMPFLRKAETAAISRALALCGYGTQFGEIGMEDEEIIVASPTGGGERGANGSGAGVGAPWNGPGACPSCRAPAGKKHASGCKL